MTPPPPQDTHLQGQTFAVAPAPVTFLTDKEIHHEKAPTAEEPTQTRPICYGRVKDPESMVPNAWWKDVFADNLYLQTDGDVVEDPAITLEEIRLLEKYPSILAILNRSGPTATTTSPASRTMILDLCCGQGRHVLKLAELYPHLELYGHDQSRYLIELAQSRALAMADQQAAVASSSSSSSSLSGEDSDGSESTMTAPESGPRHSRNPRTPTADTSLAVHFTIGDSRTVPHPDNSFAMVMLMGNSFGYFAHEQDHKDLLTEIHRILEPGGYVVMDLADGVYIRENFSPRGWEWVDDTMLVCRERQLSEDKKRLICREVVILTNKGVIRDQFYQERLYGSQEVAELLNEAGLRLELGASEQGSDMITTGKDMSKRGEDLGMMEQRNFVLARKPLNVD